MSSKSHVVPFPLLSPADPERKPPAFLPFALPDIGPEETNEVIACLKSGWLTTGKRVAQFESDFADYIGAKHALAVNSATAGLHLGLEAAGVREGDEVIVPVCTFTATAEVVRYLGADPVFVDIEAKGLNLDVAQLKAAITPKTKAIMPVHFGGQSCDMNSIMDLAHRHGLKVIEDAAHALPCTYDGRRIGTIGHATAFSFYATKTLSTGEGGMVTTDSDEIAKRIRIMRLHGIDRDVWDRYTSKKPSYYYEVVAPGFKYNMPDLMAAIGIHQLRKAERFYERRRAIAGRYTEAFKGLPLRTPETLKPGDRHSWHLYVIQLELESIGMSRDEFIEAMTACGVGTSVHFIPLHLHPYWRERYRLQPEDFPQALEYFQRAVSLPVYPSMTDADVEHVIEAVKTILSRDGRP
jgi:dTDP-4-amino-4,6-dideoxygalactose transaminase